MSQEIKCCVVKDILPLYAENLCSEETAEIVREHIENCESCRRLSEEVEIEDKAPKKIPDEAKAVCDVNNDQQINAKDALEILKYAVGKPSILDAYYAEA